MDLVEGLKAGMQAPHLLLNTVQHPKVGPSLLLISQTPMSEGLKASSGCEMGSPCGVLMGFKAGGL
jgi:hypothetical protein